MAKQKTVYYLINNRRLGKKEDGEYYLYKNAEWVVDDKCVILDCIMGFDPGDDTPFGFGSSSIMDELETIPKDKALEIQNDKTIEFLIDKWKKDMIPLKEEWDKKPVWPAKLVTTKFELNGIEYELGPIDIGLKDDCWDQGFMETFQSDMAKDLRKYGATDIYNMGFLD